MIEGKFLTVEEVADALRIHRATVTRWIKESKIPASKVGRRWLISEEAYKLVVSGGIKCDN